MIKKPGGKRNFGWGRSLAYAAKNAIKDRYGDGRFGTRYTTLRRLTRFVEFLKGLSVSDFRLVTRDTVEAYGRCLRVDVESGRLAVATAVNYLSATNVLLGHLRGDDLVWVSPKDSIGRRYQVRKVVPIGMDASGIEAFAYFLESKGESRVAAMIRLCRLLGLRHKEAALLPIANAYRQARRKGKVEVALGTKGGRSRIVCADEATTVALGALTADFPNGNVIPRTWSYIKWSRYCYRVLERRSADFGLDLEFRDLRAAFACELYERVTDRPAPVVTSGRCVDRETDHKARLQIAESLGHSRPQSAGPYIGTTRRAPE